MTSSTSKTSKRFVVIRDDMHGGYFIRDTQLGYDLRRTHNRLRRVVLAHANRMNAKAQS